MQPTSTGKTFRGLVPSPISSRSEAVSGRVSSHSGRWLAEGMQRHVWSVCFWLFVAGHVGIWLSVALLTQPNAPLDMVEALYWGEQWQWGYHKHPPMPAWIAFTAYSLSGGIWGVYLAAQLLVACCFWAAWRLGREVLAPPAALAAAALLECSYYYNFTCLDLNNTIAARGFWALAVTFLYLALTRDSLRYWLLTGAMLGIGMLSKYYVAVLAASFVVLGILDPRARRAWKTIGPYAACGVAMAIFAPHAAWVVSHDFTTLLYAVDRSSALEVPWHGNVSFPLSFLLSQAWSLLPTSLVLAFLARWPWRVQLPAGERRGGAVFVMGVTLLPLAIYLLCSAVLGLRLRSMYGAPLWTFAGVLALMVFDLQFDAPRVRRALAAWCVVVLALLTASIGRNVLGPLVVHRPFRVHFPGQALSDTVARAWESAYGSSPAIVAGPWWLAANAAVYSPADEETYANLDPRISPWTSDEELRERGGVVLWRITDNVRGIPPDVRTRFPEARLAQEINLSWQCLTDTPPLRIGMALVPPRSLARKDFTIH